MTKKGIVFWLWTASIIFAVNFLINEANSPEIFKGTTVNIPETSENLEILADTVNFSAASSDFFVLHKSDGDYIVGKPDTPPLGWNDKNYFVAEPQQIEGGKWTFASGAATIKITSEEPATITSTEPQPEINVLMLSLMGLCIWGIAILMVLL